LYFVPADSFVCYFAGDEGEASDKE